MTDNQVKGSRFLLVAPAACLCTADIGFTLMGQPTIYWAGNYNSANELNPIANFALHQGPALFVGLGVAWLVAFSLVTFAWRHPASIWNAKLIAVAHTVGGACWIVQTGEWWVLPGMTYIAAAAFLSNWSWRVFDRDLLRSNVGL